MSFDYTLLKNEPAVKNIFTVDLEDWFNFEHDDLPTSPKEWGQMESRVEAVTGDLLALLERHNTSATFFVLGWIAEQHPQLLRRIADAGHELGCHTYGHHRVNQAGADFFREDLRKTKQLVEKAAGRPPRSFRAPFFSVDESSDWVFEILAQEGFLYDSSIFPALRLDGGCPTAPAHPHVIHTDSGELCELPITVMDLFGKRFTLFGGGYFRLTPGWLVFAAICRLNRRNIPVNFYIHPHDMDEGQPRMKMGAFSTFRRYVGLSRTVRKLDAMLSRFSFCSVEQYFSEEMNKK